MSFLHKFSIAVLSTVYVAVGTINKAGAVTLNFDELGSPTPVDGLTVKGVTFDFKINGVDSSEAIYNQSFPPNFPSNLFVNLQAPLLEGNAKGILTLDFTAPISALQFAVGVETSGTLTSGLTVELFDTGLKSLGITPVDTSSLAFLSEGLFKYNGVPITRAVLDFDETKLGFDPSVAPRFSLDNLTYTAVPETSSLFGLLALGALGAGVRLLRKQQQKAL
ncbi:hypothetical protein [Brasilonema bromeliae]|uniref:PEP-CTERM protein-sorting domain-containing protein n=1 Tax=Brasilonema bromeliae SPC951 TaxID=385972 RepID=A0ABX1PEK4_9CYAN|nr:hypothetical protein [Brasilonema bromeliae]NMG22918.1 hypothetical protein [Brasilonema bromeliae SPC951]